MDSTDNNADVLPINGSPENYTENSPLLSNPETDVVPNIESGTSWVGATFIVINAALGAGLLAFPEAYHRCGGVFTALMTQAFLLALAYIALILLAYCSDMAHAATYQDVVANMCGKWWKRVCGSCIAIYCFGTCITFLIVIGDQWDRFLLFVSGDELFCTKWYMNRKFLIPLTSTILIFPLCFPKRIDFLKHVSTVGVVSILYVSVVVIVRYFVGDNHPGPIRTKPSTWTDVFIVIPTICFGYQCHVSVVPVYSCLRQRTIGNFTKTVTVALFVCGLCYSTVAVFGYLTFGGDVKPDILESYKPTPDIVAGIVLLAIKIYTTYPILHFCGRSAFETVFLDIVKLSPERVSSGEKFRRYITTTIWFLTTVLLSVTIPNIDEVISLLGGLAVVFILVLPGLCWLFLALDKREEWSKARYRIHLVSAVTFIVVGMFIFGITFTQAIIDDVSGTMKVKGQCI